jgi:hypothetical protein
MANPLSAVESLVDDIEGGLVAGGGVLDEGAAKAIAEARNAKTPEQALEILATAGIVTQTGQAIQAGAATASSPAANPLGLPQLSHLRDLVVRSVKVIVGALLIIIGVNSLLKNEGVSVPKPPAVIPV